MKCKRCAFRSIPGCPSKVAFATTNHEGTRRPQSLRRPLPSTPSPQVFPKAVSSRSAAKDTQRLGRLTGLFFLLIYATAIPPVLTLYVPALSDPAFVLGGPFDAGFNPAALAALDARQS